MTVDRLTLVTIILARILTSITEEVPDLVVAVVEYGPLDDPYLTPEERLNGNAANYIELLETLNESEVNVVVFPESSLDIGLDPNDIMMYATFVGRTENPCDRDRIKYPKHIQDLSCAAQNHDTYVVINTIEKSRCAGETCRNCRKFGHFLYNTDVVFDNEGTIVASYRKYNLYGEFELDRPLEPDHVTFSVGGHEFAVFTCFDILFRTPAEDLVKTGLKNFVFPNMWFSQLPFLTSLQTQQMWAHTHDVRLYASGANRPKAGSGGSGIYNGNLGAAVFGTVGLGGSKVYVYRYSSKTPPTDFGDHDLNAIDDDDDNVDALAKEMDGFLLSADNNLKECASKLLDLDELSNTELCHLELCCRFTTKTSPNPSSDPNRPNFYVYRLVVYSGIKTIWGVRNLGVQFCGIVACLNGSTSSCGRRFFDYDTIAWPLVFGEITVEGNFTTDAKSTQYPNSLLSSIRPINPRHTSWTKREVRDEQGEEMVERTHVLAKPQTRLMTFGIYGRNFGMDTERAGEQHQASWNGFTSLIWYCLLVMVGVWFLKSQFNFFVLV